MTNDDYSESKSLRSLNCCNRLIDSSAFLRPGYSVVALITTVCIDTAPLPIPHLPRPLLPSTSCVSDIRDLREDCLFSTVSVDKPHRHSNCLLFVKGQLTSLGLLFNPFTAPACKMFGLKTARTRPQTAYISGPMTHLLLMLSVLMKIHSHASTQNRKQKGLKVLNYALLLVDIK